MKTHFCSFFSFFFGGGGWRVGGWWVGGGVGWGRLRWKKAYYVYLNLGIKNHHSIREGKVGIRYT